MPPPDKSEGRDLFAYLGELLPEPLDSVQEREEGQKALLSRHLELFDA